MTGGPWLETERLRQRRFADTDLADLIALNSDPEVLRHLTGGRPIPRAEVATEILPRYVRATECGPRADSGTFTEDRTSVADRRSAGFGTFAAESRETGEFLGWFALLTTAEPGQAELGYRLRTAAWGRGYATEGARAVVDKAFTELGVGRVMATTMTVNSASRRVMEKAGLRFVRTFFADWPETIPGSELGDVEYAVTRVEWRP